MTKDQLHTGKRPARRRVLFYVLPAVLLAAAAGGFFLWKYVFAARFSYAQAERLFWARQYIDAAVRYESLGNYEDSAKMARLSKYNAAVSLLNDQRYIDAYRIFRKLAGVYESMDLSEYCWEKTAPEEKYRFADEILAQGETRAACMIFNTLDFRDSADRAKDLFFILQKDGLKGKMPGDTVLFGVYEQDEDLTNGPEEILWTVLEKDGDDLMLISTKVLEKEGFDSADGWACSNVRAFLNGDFCRTAFSTGHQKLLLPKTLVTNGTESTDSVFLLDSDEILRYFPEAGSRITACTTHCFHTHQLAWWLRDMVDQKSRPEYAFVKGDGTIGGYPSFTARLGLRPVLWIRVPQS